MSDFHLRIEDCAGGIEKEFEGELKNRVRHKNKLRHRLQLRAVHIYNSNYNCNFQQYFFFTLQNIPVISFFSHSIYSIMDPSVSISSISLADEDLAASSKPPSEFTCSICFTEGVEEGEERTSGCYSLGTSQILYRFFTIF